RHSTLMSAYKNMKEEKFRYYILKQKADVFHAMKSFFREESSERMA
ncbi:sporulation protein YhbH, partial [Bacillus cytotoxicus]